MKIKHLTVIHVAIVFVAVFASAGEPKMLASQALRSIGHGATARRLLVFGTGLVRPAEWEISAGDSMWVLDLKQITVRSDASLELIFFGNIHKYLF